jgi:steroid 5-alpha reductase family enzyme
MHGEYGKSIPQKLFLTVNHFIAILIVAWLLFFDGCQIVFGWFNAEAVAGNPVRNQLLLLSAIVYFLRLMVTCFYLTKRKMNWDEVISITVWIYILHVSFALLGSARPEELALVEWIGAALYLVGSWINTGSELTRYRWKRNTDNKGKLYTKGLFAFSRHINYFGDTVLFTGYAFITGNLWTLILPVIMTISFIFMHIPIKEKYLSEKYGNDFWVYVSKTKKFIPFLY